MKSITHADDSGMRLHPITKAVSKRPLPIYDKPLIYYPLSVLMLAGVRGILIISMSHDTPNFQTLLGNGSELGMKLSYAVQEKSIGLT